MSDISFHDELRRKLVHLSSFWMPAVILVFARFRWELVLFFGVLAAGSVLVEHAYALGKPTVRRCYDFFFRNMLRQQPKKSDWVVSGGPPVLAASCVALLLFPPVLAAASMALMLGGDTAAALIGRRFGKIRFSNGKSLEGFLAFLIAGSIAFALFYSFSGLAPMRVIGLSVAAALAGAFAEFFEKKIHIDDNFSIPVVAGLTVRLLLLAC
ncbi:MAG: hypothetical protein MJ016_08235 [Victivallaceae bacterium]|nr:hypothetical protein [Victivallaceae bacterium]